MYKRYLNQTLLPIAGLCIALQVLPCPLWAEDNEVLQTQDKLRQLDNQISSLKQTLDTAHDKHGLLTEELANTEKQISDAIRQLRMLDFDIKQKQTKISNLEEQVNELNKQLTNQQQLLSQHVRIRYQSGEYLPLKWLLNQDDPYKISQLLTFHTYLVQSRQHLIDNIDLTRQDLNQAQEKIKTELASKQQLQNQLHKHQEELERNKHYHKAVIRSLNDEIQTKEIKLSEVEENKANLSQLLQSLSVQNYTQPKQPFEQMRRKLPKPVQVSRQSIQKLSQGVTFFAGEGAAVTAIYPGKVVFSDWLNGYGLLLIIDHGQGFMTLYAHNQSLYKRKGETVLQGEQIATVGHSGGIKENGLYFEVRHRGKAVPPLDWIA